VRAGRALQLRGRSHGRRGGGDKHQGKGSHDHRQDSSICAEHHASAIALMQQDRNNVFFL